MTTRRRSPNGRELAEMFLAGRSILELTMSEHRCSMAHVVGHHELYDAMEARLRRALKRYYRLEVTT